MKHKHAELIKLWADGALIQRQSYNGIWIDDIRPYWHLDDNFRVKPEPNKELLVAMVFKNVLEEPVIISSMYICDPDEISPMTNVKFTFDGETGEFLKVEKI